MSPLQVYVGGVGLWSPQLANFAALRAWLAGSPMPSPAARPPAATLPANERRRAPESVLLAVEVAGQAVAMSGRQASELACVFSSAHGDQAITDYMCETLAREPSGLSPTRFHNSVHNAPAGYWTIATGCHAPSAAVCGGQLAIVGAGLLEAAMQALADQRAVLLVCSDIAGAGPLGEMTDSTQAFGCALVLTPHPGPRSLARLNLTLAPKQAPTSSTSSPIPMAWHDANATAKAALPLLLLLAGHGTHYNLATADMLGLDIHWESAA
ncbi:beta-ketoacyl synthase chain length factor [Dyella subtropica]|uniref:beta-ketoacyl synthase chain length factor n=1 Tax=Dyella subtropica TaxID=2992127 RepID=UPI0022575AC4|nr:beta-ketoacyl synthase chain length factor [Dyella subtropica]